jgi:hypothetical protein
MPPWEWPTRSALNAPVAASTVLTYLTDPDARFRLLLALRVRQLLAGAEAATKYSHASDTEAGPAVSMVEVFNRKDTTWTNSEILKA